MIFLSNYSIIYVENEREVIDMTWRQRRSELVLKSFVSTLTEEEKTELEAIDREHEEELFHEAVFQMLYD